MLGFFMHRLLWRSNFLPWLRSPWVTWHKLFKKYSNLDQTIEGYPWSLLQLNQCWCWLALGLFCHTSLANNVRAWKIRSWVYSHDQGHLGKKNIFSRWPKEKENLQNIKKKYLLVHCQEFQSNMKAILLCTELCRLGKNLCDSLYPW